MVNLPTQLTSSIGGNQRLTRAQWLGGVLATATVAAIVIHFHGRFWWPPDDGAYAYVASQLLRGSVLSADVQDIHPGYVHLIHATAFGLFGEDIKSLRYPLTFLTVLQATLVYLLLVPKGVFISISGAITAGALSFVQFLNPSANWYALFVAIAVVASLAWMRPGLKRYLVIGLLLGLAVLLRQVSGIFLAMGTIAWLTWQPTKPALAGRVWLAKATHIIMFLGLAGYFISKGSISGFAMFGIWPLILIFFGWRGIRMPNREFAVMAAGLTGGAAIVASPLVFYLAFHGIVALWFNDVVIAALQLNSSSFMSAPSFSFLAIGSLGAILHETTLASAMSGLFWLALLLIPVVSGAHAALKARSGPNELNWHPAAVVPIFFAPVSAHYEIPIYLTYTTCLSILSLSFLFNSKVALRAVAGASLTLSLIGLLLNAGQPLTRGYEAVVRGKTIALDAFDGIPKARITMERRDANVYTEVVSLIHSYSRPDDVILTLPFIPEFYFLSEREAAVRFLGVPFGLARDEQLARTIDELEKNPPEVVINRREDKYHSPLSKQLLEWVDENFIFLRSVGDFDVYVAK